MGDNSSANTFHFVAELSLLSFGKYSYQVIYLPDDIKLGVAAFGSSGGKGRIRIRATIGNAPHNAAILPAGGGELYIIVGPKLRKETGLQLGDLVPVSFEVVDNALVEVPEDFQAALSENGKAAAIWDFLTPGKQRGFLYLISTAKTAPTRQKRINEVIKCLDSGKDRNGKSLMGDLPL